MFEAADLLSTTGNPQPVQFVRMPTTTTAELDDERRSPVRLGHRKQNVGHAFPQ